MNCIYLRLCRTGYIARWEGPEAARIFDLFGTTEIPTGFTAHAAPDVVLAEIQRLNPDCTVSLEKN